MVREIRWVRWKGPDDPRPAEPRIRDAEVDVATATGWCREAAGIRIPIVGYQANMGLDGMTYTLSSEAGFASAHLSWWSSGWSGGPREWSELTAWARSMMERLHAYVSPAEPLDGWIPSEIDHSK
jgi:hypothetical protein